MYSSLTKRFSKKITVLSLKNSAIFLQSNILFSEKSRQTLSPKGKITVLS